MAKKRDKNSLPRKKQEMYQKNSEIIAYWRRNPVIACEDILGIKLLDVQKWILIESWNKPHILWCCSRNFGKSFLASIIIILKALLYENQQIYIVSNVGSQAQECFMKIEKIAMNRIESIQSIKDIFANETVKLRKDSNGFSHNPGSYHVSFYNGSEIFTLNGNVDNNRSRLIAQLLL